MTDDRKKARVTKLANGNLQVDGFKYELRRATPRSLYLDAMGIAHRRSWTRGYRPDDSYSLGEALTTRGELDKGALSIAGTDTTTKVVPVNFKPSDEAAWTCLIGHVGYDWEIGYDAEFFMELYLPSAVFSELMKRYLCERPLKLSIGVDAELWVRDFDWHAPPSVKIEYFLVPEDGGYYDMPETAKGTVTHFGWSDLPLDSRPPQQDKDDNGESSRASPSSSIKEPTFALLTSGIERRLRMLFWGLIVLIAVVLVKS